MIRTGTTATEDPGSRPESFNNTEVVVRIIAAANDARHAWSDAVLIVPGAHVRVVFELGGLRSIGDRTALRPQRGVLARIRGVGVQSQGCRVTIDPEASVGRDLPVSGA